MNLTKQQQKAARNLAILDHCSKVPQYALRVECESDCIAIRAVLAPWLVLWRDDQAYLFLEDGTSLRIPDRDVVFSLDKTGPTLPEVRWLIESVIDCHVAAGSLAEADAYTGERLPHGEMFRCMSRPADVLIGKARDSARRAQEFYLFEFDRLEEAAEKFDADLGNEASYLKRQRERSAEHARLYEAQQKELDKKAQRKRAAVKAKSTNV